MPDIDGGHYFLTALVPVKTEPAARADGSIAAPSHILREELASLPTAVQSAACAAADRLSPFARCRRTHFARLFVIDQPAYNGRDPADAIVAGLRNTDLLAHQPVDCLPCPWLVVVIDFDANGDEADGGLSSYLRGLWERSRAEMTAIFGRCYGFDPAAAPDRFAAWLASCQVETTMPFNDYWPGAPTVPKLGIATMAAVALGVAGGALLLEILGLRALGGGLRWLWLGAPIAIALGLFALYRFILGRGHRSWPAAPAATLPHVLKALYLQQRFTRFAIAHQRDEPATLHAAFGAFVAEHRPSDLAEPTRLPGTIDA